MKRLFYWAFCLLGLCTACHEPDDSNVIEVDLDTAGQEIAYSRFVESVEEVTLHLPDSVPVTGVERLYFDGDKIFIGDSGGEGIFVFDGVSGNLLSRLNAFGEGPEEIKRIGAFCLDPYRKRMCIFDKGDRKLKMYDYGGRYVHAVPVSSFFLDMVKLEEHSMTYFYPIYAGGEQPEGVWTCDSLDRLVKRVDAHVTEDCKFHYFPVMYNWDGKRAYYYDRNWDELSVVTADTLEVLHKFHLRNAIPLSVKGKRDLSPQDLEGRSILHYFACSERFLLVNFYTFRQEDPYGQDVVWLLLDRETGETEIAKSLKNDLTPHGTIENNSLFYKDDRTWVRVDDTSDNAVRLELLHLR